jgi:hypothetical protein
MKRLCVLLLLASALLVSSGCGPEWEDFWRDARGDNQKMRFDNGQNDSSR